MLGVEFQLPALERLAKTLAGAHTGTGITDLFRRADFGMIQHDGGTKWRFLCSTFADMQGRFGAESVLKVLEVACSPQEALSRLDMKEVNACLAPYGLEIGEDGKARGLEAKSFRGEGAALFDQRGYHRLVVEHGREKFLQGDYFGAVGDCCREFEGLIRRASGLELSGRRLMGRALDPRAGMAGSLEKALPNATQESRDGAQEEAMHLAMGIMAGPRNSTAHEPKKNFPIGRDDALDKLTVISHVLVQLDRAGFGAGPAPPARGGHMTAGGGKGAGEPGLRGGGGGEPAGEAAQAGRGGGRTPGGHGGHAAPSVGAGGEGRPVLAWAESGDGEPIAVYGEGRRPGGLKIRIVNVGRASAEEIVVYREARLVGSGAAPRLKTRRLGALEPGKSIEVHIPMPTKSLGRAFGGAMVYVDAVFEYGGSGTNGLAYRVAGYMLGTLSMLFVVDDVGVPHGGAPEGNDLAAPETRDAMAASAADANRALETAEVAIGKDPGDAVARRERAAALRALGRHEEALQEICLAEKASPVDARVLREAARILERLGRPDEAVGALRRILERGHGDLCVHRELARLHALLGAYDEAYGAWAAIARQDPSYETYMSMAATRTAVRSYGPAAAAFGKAIDVRLGDAHAHVQKGMALSGCGRHEEAVATLRRATGLDPGMADAHVALALALYKLGMEAEACDELGLAVGAEPDNHRAHIARGVIALEAGLPDDAEESFRKAARLDPSMRVPQARDVARARQRTRGAPNGS